MSFDVKEFSLFRDFPEPVFIMSPDGTILEANQVFVNKFFCTLDNIRGKNVFELLSETLHIPEIAASRKAWVDKVMSTGEHVIFDDEGSDGTIIRSSVYPVKSPEGTISRLLVIVHDVTEQVAAETAAHHIDCVYKALLNAIPGSVFILDDDFLLVSCNSYAFELFGDFKMKIRNNNFFHLFFREDRPRIKKLLTDLIESAQEGADEARMHIHDDQYNYSWFSIHAQKTTIDNRTYVVLVCIDISRLKISESHLFEYKKWLIKAMEAGNTGVWDWNIVTDAALWSNRLWALYGIERAPGQYPSFQLWETAIHPDDQELVVESVKKAVSILADLNIQYRVVHQDGSIHWILSNGKPLYDKHGEVKHYCGTSIDVTDQKKFEEEIILVRGHIDFVLEKFHIGWWHLNLEDHSVVRTIEHAKIFGYDSLDMEWSFDRFLEHVVEEDRERVKKIVFDSIANKKDYMVECWINKKSGEKRKIWASGSLLCNDHGKPTHVVGIIQDITDRDASS